MSSRQGLIKQILKLCLYIYIYIQVRNLELLKLRFGESNLHFCEVMVKDIADSKRINTYVHTKLAQEKEAVISWIDWIFLIYYSEMFITKNSPLVFFFYWLYWCVDGWHCSKMMHFFLRLIVDSKHWSWGHWSGVRCIHSLSCILANFQGRKTQTAGLCWKVIYTSPFEYFVICIKYEYWLM